MASQIKSAPRLVELVNRTATRPNRKLMETFAKENKLASLASPSPRSVSQFGGEKSYMLIKSFAKLERALARWSMDELVNKHHFTPVVAPNIIHDHIVEKCGFPTHSGRSQVYKIAGSDRDSLLDEKPVKPSDKNRVHSCLAGTSEFALVSLHIGDIIPSDELPKLYCALSRCYRAETSEAASEFGLYRVHYFNKVEMVALTMPSDSDKVHEKFLAIQKDLFSQLNLHFKILDMPSEDLGLSATKKYDIEAWMPGRGRFGEISSTSNCQDYQSSRLNIKYSRLVESNDQLDVDSDYVHTVNGTACSTIRTMIALVEEHLSEDGKRVEIPEVLRPYMNGSSHIPTLEDERFSNDLELELEPEYDKPN